MEQRQAIVEPVLRRRAGEAGEPKAPIEDAAVADACGFRQAGRPGRVDQQGPVVDGDVTTLVRRKRPVIEGVERDIDRTLAAGIAVGQTFASVFKCGNAPDSSAASSCATMM